jgi:hypothetical protein
MFLLLIIWHRFHEDNLCPDIFCNRLNLEFPEMGRLNLELAAGHRDDAVLWGFHSFSDFLAFAYIDLHFLHLHNNIHIISTFWRIMFVPCGFFLIIV